MILGAKRRIHVSHEAIERVAWTSGRPIEFTATEAVLALPTCELVAALVAAGADDTEAGAA